jgi:hypothetical protein
VSAAESTKSDHCSGHLSGVEPKSGSQAQAVFFSTQVSATGSFSPSSPVDGDLGNELCCQRLILPFIRRSKIRNQVSIAKDRAEWTLNADVMALNKIWIV